MGGGARVKILMVQQFFRGNRLRLGFCVYYLVAFTQTVPEASEGSLDGCIYKQLTVNNHFL